MGVWYTEFLLDKGSSAARRVASAGGQGAGAERLSGASRLQVGAARRGVVS